MVIQQGAKGCRTKKNISLEPRKQRFGSRANTGCRRKNCNTQEAIRDDKAWEEMERIRSTCLNKNDA